MPRSSSVEAALFWDDESAIILDVRSTWGCSSAGERLFGVEEVEGSIPSSSTSTTLPGDRKHDRCSATTRSCDGRPTYASPRSTAWSSAAGWGRRSITTSASRSCVLCAGVRARETNPPWVGRHIWGARPSTGCAAWRAHSRLGARGLSGRCALASRRKRTGRDQLAAHRRIPPTARAPAGRRYTVQPAWPDRPGEIRMEGAVTPRPPGTRFLVRAKRVDGARGHTLA